MNLFSLLLTFFALIAGFYEYIVPKNYKIKKYKNILFNFIISLFVILLCSLFYKFIVIVFQKNNFVLWIKSKSELILYVILLINVMYHIFKCYMIYKEEKLNFIIENSKIYKDNEYIKIPNNITKIERFDFINCESLKGLNINENVSIIEEGSFVRCENIKKIEIRNNENYCIKDVDEEYKGEELSCVYTPKKIGEKLVSKNEKEIFTYTEYDENLEIKETKVEFQNVKKIIEYKGKEEYIVIKSNTIINEKAFRNNKNICEVEINNIVFIYPKAFYKCENINNIIINDNDIYF